MTAVKLQLNHFSGLSHVADRGTYGLASILRGMLIDNARLKVEVAGVVDFTNNSGGTALAVIAAPVPVTPVDATIAGSAEALASFNASLVKIANAGAVITATINEASALLGLPANTAASGVVASANVIPAQDLTGTTGLGVLGADFATGVAAINTANLNLAALANGVNEVLVAIGANPVPVNLGETNQGLAAVVIPVAVASAVVANTPSALALADTTAWLAAYAGSLAALAVAWNAAMNQGTPGPLHVVAG